MSNLIDHAQRELKLAGLDDPSDGVQHAINANILELIAVFAAQGHSGTTAAYVLSVFDKLARFRTISANDHALYEDRTQLNGGKTLWQDVRDSRWFSDDEGKTWWSIEKGGLP